MRAPSNVTLAVVIVTRLCPSPSPHLARPPQVHRGVLSLSSWYPSPVFSLFLECTTLLPPSGIYSWGRSHGVTHLSWAVSWSTLPAPPDKPLLRGRNGLISLSVLGAKHKAGASASFVKEKDGSSHRGSVVNKPA